MSDRLWKVFYTTAAHKQLKKLSERVLDSLTLLIRDIEDRGPIQKDWPHFSALGKTRNVPSNSYHCHIKSGRPTYVVCWQVTDKTIRIVEIFYVGTHENTPY